MRLDIGGRDIVIWAFRCLDGTYCVNTLVGGDARVDEGKLEEIKAAIMELVDVR